MGNWHGRYRPEATYAFKTYGRANTATHKTCPRCRAWTRRIGANKAYCMRCQSKNNQPFKRKKYHRNRQLWWNYLLQKGCQFCGLRDPRCLEADHLHQRNKRLEVSRMLVEGYSWEHSILPELKKCRIICANCSRVRTCHQLGYWHRRKKLPPGVLRWKQYQLNTLTASRNRR